MYVCGKTKIDIKYITFLRYIKYCIICMSADQDGPSCIASGLCWGGGRLESRLGYTL
jgi:hypothetical protein